ncbi:MAG: GNAT family N-acetyltransferase [Bacteroidia bacterium]|jgi:GNAT superfamily N-acetyltransferase|nr:GNAT family N-acetyltransferase [Bacteroidia bacterium]
MLETQNGYELSDDKSRLDHDFIHHELSHSYWAEAIPRSLTEKSVQHSLCFGIYHNGSQVAFARVVSDFATFGYLCDVIVSENHRGAGLGKWLMQCIMAHPDIQGLRRFMLATRDAHTLYERFGFHIPAHPERLMEIVYPGMYKAQQADGNL